jgi:DNA-binding CsgD family transcriptional regulator
VTAGAAVASHHRTELIERAGRAGSVRELFAAASERLQRLVAFDAAVWLATDPATNLPTAPARSENLGHICRGDGDSCLRVWELEFLVEDVNLYRDLARAEVPAGGLRIATRDRPARSPRYREYLRPNGFDDELRAVMRVDHSPWVSVGLFRERGRPAFDARDTELVASLSRPLAEAVRDHARPATRSPMDGDARGPGLMLFAPTGELISVNDDALAWLDELPPDSIDADSFNVRLPMVVAGALMRARAVAQERDHQTARARLRAVTGRWLVCHASCLRDADGEIGNTALVIEPAQGSEIVPLMVAAYELTQHERDITQLIAQGLSTAEIADALRLSAHTVRDYVKAIFEKVGVSTRGELVARIFTEHYAPMHLHPGSHEAVGS